MRVAVLRERAEGERRVAATRDSVKKLVELGLEVAVEAGAGADASQPDEGYVAAGATVEPEREKLLASADLVLKVRPPTKDEVALLREGSILVSHLYADRNPDVVAALVERKVTSLALEKVPRVTRAQKMDVLSSMANLAGYRAVVEAAEQYQCFFGPQVTAAGSLPPARVLVIGAGVAGLAAVAAARALGADVRAFDTRPATREQVESLGATFLTIELDEDGEGGGGYAKVMSEAFLAAEIELFTAQAREVDVIVTTALVPGTKAPVLLPTSLVEVMKRGSVIVDLAAEQGGNCELTRAGQVVEHRGVRIIGYTDLTSRMARTASVLFANNLVHLVRELGPELRIDLDDDVIRPALVTHAGEKLAPPPPKEPTPPKASRSNKPPPHDAKPKQVAIMKPSRRAWGSSAFGGLVIVLLFLLGRFAPLDFLQHFTVFILACFVGWQVIWSVSPSLHTPLMSVTNAISGIIVLGGMLQIGRQLDAASALGAAAVLVATINIAGGFLVTHRMLQMFRRGDSR